MKRVWCCIRPHRLEEVKTAVSSLPISGMSVHDVRGVGASEEMAGMFATVALPLMSRLEVVVPDELVDSVVESIVRSASSGESGDGKIFVEKVSEVVRIRTSERGEAAI